MSGRIDITWTLPVAPAIPIKHVEIHSAVQPAVGTPAWTWFANFTPAAGRQTSVQDPEPGGWLFRGRVVYESGPPSEWIEAEVTVPSANPAEPPATLVGFSAQFVP